MSKILIFSIKLILGLLMVVYLYDTILEVGSLDIKAIFLKLDPLKVVLSIVSYLFSHFLRVIRFTLMLGRQNYSIVELVKKQYYTNMMNLLIPFKLGEFYRISEFDKIIKNYRKTFLTVIAERSIDVLLIICGLLLSSYLLYEHFYFVKMLVVSGGILLIAIAYMFLVLPQNLRYFNIFLIKRFTNKNTLNLLKISSSVHDSLEIVRNIILNEKSTLLVLSVLVWVLEIFSFYFLMDYLPSYSHLLFLSCLVFVSAFLPSGSLGLGGIQLAFFLVFGHLSKNLSLELSFTYQLIIFVPAILIGLVFWIFSLVKINKR